MIASLLFGTILTLASTVVSGPLTAVGVAVAVAALGLTLASAAEWLVTRLALRAPPANQPETFEDRVHALLEALGSASGTVTELEHAVRTRQELVSELQTQQRVLQLTDDQRAAINDIFQAELQRDQKRSFWLAVTQSTVFFLLGIGAAILSHQLGLT